MWSTFFRTRQCTNLIHLSTELLEICSKYDIFISTSLDGPKFLHDHNRGSSGSHNKFEESVKIVRNKIGQNKLSPLMTTSELSLNYPKQIIDEYRRLDFHSIFLRPLNPYGKALNTKDWNNYYEKFLKFYKESLSYIISINKSGEYFREDFTALLVKKILSPFPIGFVDLQSPAGIINSVIVYNYDGYVYCSDESRMLAEAFDYTFRLGKLSDSYEDIFYGRKAQKLSKLWATEYIAGCSDCAFQQFCGADPVRNYSTQGDPYGTRPTSLFCTFHKSVFEYLFSLMDEKKEEVMPLFLSWAYE